MEKYISEQLSGYSLVDNYTGEIKGIKVSRKITVDQFITVFLKTLPDLMHLDGKPLKLLILCWKNSSFNPEKSDNGNIVNNNKTFKDAVRESGLELSDAGIDAYMSKLAKKGFLIKRCHGEYQLNPNYFFKGYLRDLSEVKMTLEGH